MLRLLLWILFRSSHCVPLADSLSSQGSVDLTEGEGLILRLLVPSMA